MCIVVVTVTVTVTVMAMELQMRPAWMSFIMFCFVWFAFDPVST